MNWFPVIIYTPAIWSGKGKFGHTCYFCVAGARKDACWGTPHAGGRGLVKGRLVNFGRTVLARCASHIRNWLGHTELKWFHAFSHFLYWGT